MQMIELLKNDFLGSVIRLTVLILDDGASL